MPVSNVTEFSNMVTLGNDITASSSPAFVKGTCMVNLIANESLPVGTMTKKFRKDGSLTAAIVAESTALSLSSSTEYTETSADATIAKAALVSALSVEGESFTSLSLQKLGDEQFAAIGRYVDNDCLSLFSSLTHSVTATGVNTTMTIEDVLTGQFNIYNSDCPNPEVPLQCVLTPKAHQNIKQELIQSAASVWTNESFLQIMNSNPQPNRYVGSVPGLADFYMTTGHATSSTNSVQAIFHPKWTFGGCFAPAPISWLIQKGSEGLYWELTSYFFYDVLVWNDFGGCKLLSLT